MSIARLLLLALMVLATSAHAVSAQAQAQEQDEENQLIIDLAAIPLTPTEMTEPGYLLEGGGYIFDPATLENLIASLDGGEPGGFTSESWQRSYMHRLVLLSDTLDPSSDLLADEISLVHEFDSPEAATESYEALVERFTALGEPTGADTYRVVNESANSLISYFVTGSLAVQVISTDLTGQPNPESHQSTVDKARLRAEVEAFNPVPALSASALRVDDEKLVTFADTPDSYQQYQTQSGTWIPSIEFPERNRSASEFGIVEVFESQQQIVLNTGDQIVFQVWLAEFESDATAQAFVANPKLGELPTPMFADQAEADAVTGESGFSVRGVLEDGSSYSGFRDISQVGSRVAVTGLLGSGDQVINREQATALADLQATCLEGTVCEPVSSDAILEVDAESTPEPTPGGEGTFTSAIFPWSVDYAAAGWELNAVEDVEAVDFLDLKNGQSLATIETVVDRHGDPPTCVIDELRLLEEFENHAVITLGSDVEGEQTTGNEPGHAWAVYTVEPLADERADQEYTIRMDCYTLVVGEASLVVTHIAPRDMWEAESAKGNDLRSHIVIPDATGAISAGADVKTRNVNVIVPRIWIPRIEIPRAA